LDTCIVVWVNLYKPACATTRSCYITLRIIMYMYLLQIAYTLLCRMKVVETKLLVVAYFNLQSTQWGKISITLSWTEELHQWQSQWCMLQHCASWPVPYRKIWYWE